MKLKKIISLLLAAVLSVSIFVMPAIASGSDFTIANGVLTAYNGSGGNVVIPSEVTSIRENAFFDCTSLTSVTLPSSVKSIGNNAFYGCTSLTSTSIPDSVKSIGCQAFEGCENLTSVTIPNSVTSIGDGAFMDCTGLTSVTISNSVTSIGEQIFQSCEHLTSVTIPNGVKSIGIQAFGGCTGLTSIIIPNSVTSIGDGAFYDCSSFTISGVSNSCAHTFAQQNNIPFTVLTCTIEFISNGAKVYNTTVDCNFNIDPPVNPTRTGYVFDGWFTTPTGGTKVDFSTYKPSSNTIFYAQWTSIYTLTFSTQGGSTISSQTVVSGSIVTAPVPPTKELFSFVGWFTAPTGGTKVDFSTYKLSGNTTLYAQWAVSPIIIIIIMILVLLSLLGMLFFYFIKNRKKTDLSEHNTTTKMVAATSSEPIKEAVSTSISKLMLEADEIPTNEPNICIIKVKCTSCGTLCDKDTTFCSNCGARL